MFILPYFLLFSQISAMPRHKVMDEIDISRYDEAIYDKPSLETGKLVSEWNEDMEVNPEELGEYLEGDILFQKRTKNGLVALSTRWRNGVVPYVIKGPYSEDDIKIIFDSMNEYHKNSCIRFRRKTSDDHDYIRIQNTKTGCWSSVGRIGGEQDLNLQSPGCLSRIGTPVHELLHALGFHHEQTRTERDDYVTINFDNISAGREKNFAKSNNGTTTNFGVEYDYDSVMHYSKYAFSKNQKPTIEPRQMDATIGQRDGFSKGDLIKLNKMYNCSGDSGSITTEQPIYTTPVAAVSGLGELISTIFG